MPSRRLCPVAVLPAALVLLVPSSARADARVRFLQATPGADAAGLTLASRGRTVRTTPMAFGEVSGRVEVPAGRVTLRHRPAGSGRVATSAVTLADGRSYTVVATGPADRPALRLRPEGRARRGAARVRVAHVARELGAPDLVVDGKRAVERFPYLATTPYLALAPGRHTVSAVRPGTTSELISATVTLKAGTTSTAYVLGSAGQPTQALLTRDATVAARRSSSRRTTGRRAATVRVVRPGDTLWAIAREQVGARASGARVWQEVLRLWAVNGHRVASGDPDVILPGLRLRLR